MTATAPRDGDLAAIVHLLYESRPAWHAGAACRGRLDVMFPRSLGKAARERARQLCDVCPVVDECRRAGEGEPFGIWAGMTKKGGHPDPLAPAGLVDAGRLAYSIDDVARVLDTSRRSVHRLIAAGELIAQKLGSRTLIHAGDLRRFLEARAAANPPGATPAPRPRRSPRQGAPVT